MSIKDGQGASGVRGVYKLKWGVKRWGGKVSVNGKPIYLGYFLTVEEAAEAVRLARIKYGLNTERRIRTVPTPLVSHALVVKVATEMNPAFMAEVVGEAIRRREIAKQLGTTAEALPEGWDLV